MEPPFDDDLLSIPTPAPETSAAPTEPTDRILPTIVVDNVPPPPFAEQPPAALVEGALENETPQTAPPRGDQDARCIALIGAHGGAGTTTLAIQMAYDLATRLSEFDRQNGVGGFRKAARTDARVCLIDLNFETGTCATYLDLPPSLELADLCAGPDRVDPSLTRALISTHDRGVALLSAKNVLGANAMINGQTVLALLDAASQMYDYVFLDMPRLWCPWTQAVISAADHVAMVTQLTIPALHMTRSRMESVEQLLSLERPCEVILNQVERRSFRNALKISDADKALKRPISGVICVDTDTTREAINCGEPVGAVRAEARYVKDVRHILAAWDLLPQKSIKKAPKVDRRKSARTSWVPSLRAAKTG